MDAARTGAKSQLAIEEAARDTTTAEGLASLARAYFGRQLAVEARDVRQDLVGRMERLVAVCPRTGTRTADRPRPAIAGRSRAGRSNARTGKGAR